MLEREGGREEKNIKQNPSSRNSLIEKFQAGLPCQTGTGERGRASQGGRAGCSWWTGISVTPAGNASTSAPRGAAGLFPTARALRCHPRHTKSKRAGLEMLAPGRGERCRPGRRAPVCMVCSHPAKVLIPLLFPWILRFLTSRAQLHSPEERSTGAAFLAWWGGGTVCSGAGDTFQRRQHRWNRGATCPSVPSHLFLQLTLPGSRQAGSHPDLLGTSNRTMPKSGS